MVQRIVGTNTLYYDLECPHCGKVVRSGIGFQVGVIRQLNYHVGEKLKWEGHNRRPAERPPDGNLKTIGYFNCDNPRCETWKDCFPEIQEALVVIEGDVIQDVKVITFRPGEQSFAILEPEGLS